MTDPAEIAVREAAAASLKLPPESIAVHRTSSRAGLSAWRAFPAGQERSPGGAMVTALVDDGEVLTGKAGFATWLERHGRADPVATAIAWYVLVERSALEPYGSWTRGARQKPDPAYDADGKLVFFHSEPLKGRVMETKLAFADDGTVTPESRPR